MKTKRSKTQRPSIPGNATNKVKGNIVESIVAMMHQSEGVKVTAPAYLPGRGNNRTRKREIDVLLESSISGYHVKIAIECKNEKGPIGSPKIDAFNGKLRDVGIPVQHGVYVSASGYTQDAIDVAKAAGIRALTLKGLTANALESAIHEAVQNIVFVSATVVHWGMTNTYYEEMMEEEGFFLYDKEEKAVKAIPDLLWEAWISGNIPRILGTHEIKIKVPDRIHQRISNKHVTVFEISATIKVRAHIVHIPGTATQHQLVDEGLKEIDKLSIKVSFDTSPRIYEIYAFEDEAALNEYLSDLKFDYSITLDRQILPRIIFSAAYWQPSKKALDRIKSKFQPFLDGSAPDPRPLKFEEIEGKDLSAAFEPIFDSHPAMIYMREWEDQLKKKEATEE